MTCHPFLQNSDDSAICIAFWHSKAKKKSRDIENLCIAKTYLKYFILNPSPIHISNENLKLNFRSLC